MHHRMTILPYLYLERSAQGPIIGFPDINRCVLRCRDDKPFAAPFHTGHTECRHHNAHDYGVCQPLSVR